MEKVEDVNWSEYFKSIRVECPWSWAAYQRGLIDIVNWEDRVIPLGSYAARVYVIEDTEEVIQGLCQSLDYGVDEWLFSYPGYGPWAAPVGILIQQNRQQLNDIRKSL